jgi:hypothetical protein
MIVPPHPFQFFGLVGGSCGEVAQSPFQGVRRSFKRATSKRLGGVVLTSIAMAVLIATLVAGIWYLLRGRREKSVPETPRTMLLLHTERAYLADLGGNLIQENPTAMSSSAISLAPLPSTRSPHGTLLPVRLRLDRHE